MTPTLTHFTPLRGVAGDSITIFGTNFTGATSVAFNGAWASFTVDSQSQISAIVPSGATSGPISITTPSGIVFSSVGFVVGGGNGNGGDSPTIEEIKAAVGSSVDGTTYALNEDGVERNWSIVSLLRGLFNQLSVLVSGYVTLFVQIVGTVSISSASDYVVDYSGVIENTAIPLRKGSSTNRKFLFIQNLGKYNSSTGLYEGDLWINFAPSGSFEVIISGPGCYRLSPGSSISFDGVTVPGGDILISANMVGIEYTMKEI